MTFRPGITSMAIATFLVTLALLSWKQGTWPWPRPIGVEEPTVPPSTTREQHREPTRERATADLPPPPPSTTAAVAPVHPVPPDQTRIVAAASTASDAAAAEPPPVPGNVFFRKQPGESNFSTTLRNVSSRPVQFTVSAVNAGTGKDTQVQVLVGPNSNIDLAGAGLVVEHGDELTIAGVGFADRRIRAH